MIDTRLQHHTKTVLKRGVALLVNANITANQITVMGLFLGFSAAVAAYFQQVAWSLVLLYLSGLCDILDGIVAREMGGGSILGTLFDITFDRLVEISIIIALAYRYPQFMMPFLWLLASIIFCMTVFLTVGILVQKESHKTFYYATGIMERTETFILFTLLLLFPKFIAVTASIGAVLIFVTGAQRFIFAIQHFSSQK